MRAGTMTKTTIESAFDSGPNAQTRGARTRACSRQMSAYPLGHYRSHTDTENPNHPDNRPTRAGQGCLWRRVFIGGLERDTRNSAPLFFDRDDVRLDFAIHGCLPEPPRDSFRCKIGCFP